MQRSLAAIAAGFLAVMIMAPRAGAQEQPGQGGVPPRIGVSARTELSLIETLNMALANNKDIESSRIDREISRFSLTGAEGVYDFRVGAQTNYLKSVTPIGSVLGGGPDGELTQRDVGVVPQLSGSIPWTGASFSFNFNSKRTVNNSTFSTLNPQFPSSVTASITQPLRRGLRFDANRQKIEVARKNMALTDEQFRQRVTDIVTQVTRAYWDLAFTRRNLDVQAKAAETARRQVESNRRMVEQGVLAPMDVVEAETQLAQITQDVFTAQALLSTAENLLKAMILPERTSPLWWSELVPTTPPDGAPVEDLLQDAVDEALAGRPELAQVKAASEINQTNLRYYKEQTKPQLDLVASYMAAGLAGEVRPSAPNPFTGSFPVMIQRLNELSAVQGLTPIDAGVLGGSGGGVPQALVGGYGQSLSNLYTWGFPTVQVSLQLSLPLRNRTAEANLATGIAEVHRTENRRKQVEQQIEAEVRNSMQLLTSFKNALEAARVARRSAEELYASEQRKFQAGTSTVFLVLQRQTTLVTSQSAELRAQSELAKSVAEFQRATGRILAAHNIVIQSALGKRP